HRESVIDLARELIRVPSENPPGAAYPAAVEVLVTSLEKLGLPVRRIPLGPGREAVMSAVGEGPSLYLHGHYDVVPASVAGQFEPVVRGDRLFGRGSADMKGALSSMVHAVAALRELGHPGRVELVLVPDEETGGQGGMARLVEAGEIDSGALGAVLGEPTSGVIWNGSRGALTGRIRLEGEAAHVGLHYQGRNAVEGAVPVLSALLELKAEVSRHRTSLAIEPEAARRSILMIGGEVQGRHQFNLVPDRFEFTVERRFNPEEDLADVRGRLDEVIRRHVPEGLQLSIDFFQQATSSLVPTGHPLVTALMDVVEVVEGRRPPAALCPGLLESRFYGTLGVPAVAYGPGLLEVSHGPNEWVNVQRLLDCVGVYALLAERVAGTSLSGS
ncbi:MAG: M20/M25/M40 family metallo-hydrolase, partial [Gemmatimonadota bacterium]|nr:M20/M25/M40 family metallo-hydrolase [Gemmatimonadota bacterium]